MAFGKMADKAGEAALMIIFLIAVMFILIVVSLGGGDEKTGADLR